MKSDIKLLLELEHKVSAGERPAIPDSNLALKAYEARIFSGNAKMSEALCELNPENAIQKLKTFIHRGNLVEARELALGLLELSGGDTETQIEIFLELARISLYEGDWEQCIQLSRDASRLHPPLMCQMTLWQLEAAALGEHGHIDSALKRIEQVESLRSMFPGGNVLFYARNQKVNLWALQGRQAEAERLLRDLWRELLGSQDGTVSWDKLETLARTELKLSTRFGRAGDAWATLSRKCCRESGDLLFEHVALADLGLHSKVREATLSESLLQVLLNSPFRRVRKFVQSHGLDSVRTRSSDSKGVEETLDFRFVFLAQQERLIDLENRASLPLPSHSIIARSLQAIGSVREPLSVESFFQSVYGFGYHKGRHSGTLRTLMTRIRQNTHMEISVKDNLVRTDYPFLVIGSTECR